MAPTRHGSDVEILKLMPAVTGCCCSCCLLPLDAGDARTCEHARSKNVVEVVAVMGGGGEGVDG